jgi:hypothetical protein
MSNKWVRRHAQHAFIDALLEDFAVRPDVQRVWVTVAWDAGVTWECAPSLDTISLRNIANQHLRRSGLHGLGILEIDTWKEIAGEPGKRMVAHVHFTGWAADGEKIDVRALQTDLQNRRALTNALNFPSVVVKEIGSAASDLAAIGRYMGKAPTYAKNPVPVAAGGNFELKQVSHAPGSAVRLVELLSHVEVGDLLFSIGRQGGNIAKEVRSKVAQAVRPRAGVEEAPSRDDVTRHWRRIRLINGNKKFRDCTVITRRDQR